MRRAGGGGRAARGFTGLDDGAVDLTAPIPNTSKVGVWRIEPDNSYNLIGRPTIRSPSRRSSTKCSVQRKVS
jgi:hypothetical protein